MSSRNFNLGIQNAQPSAQAIVRNDSDRVSLAALFGALYGDAARVLSQLRDSLWHPSMPATRATKTRVTGGACCAVARQRSGRRAAMRRLAA
jgi:hypothetical protein